MISRTPQPVLHMIFDSLKFQDLHALAISCRFFNKELQRLLEYVFLYRKALLGLRKAPLNESEPTFYHDLMEVHKEITNQYVRKTLLEMYEVNEMGLDLMKVGDLIAKKVCSFGEQYISIQNKLPELITLLCLK